MKKLLSLALALVLLLSFGSGVFAEGDDSGSSPAIKKPVSITVTDDTGAAVAGAVLEILDENGQLVETFTSTAYGGSVFLGEGNYTLKLTSVPEGYIIREAEQQIQVTLLEAELRDDLAGMCYFDHDHSEVCSNPKHVGIETYAIFDGSGSMTAYCFNQNYDEPDGTNCYRRLVGTPELLYSLAQNKNGSVGPQELYDHVLSMIYHRSYIQSKYGFDDTITRYLVNMAIKSFTDPAVFNTFDDDGNSTLARDENGRPIRDENGNYVFNPGGTVLGSLIHHAYACNGNQDTFPQAYRDAYHELISFTDHPSDYYLYIYYPSNFQPGNTSTYQCLMSVFTVEPVRVDFSVGTATSTSITKVWEDADNQDGLRPDEEAFTNALHLLADGTDVTDSYRDKLTVTDNGDNTYTAAFTDLPKRNDSGDEIVYTIREDAFPGYTADKATAGNGETITNTHEPKTTEIPVTKTWEDGDDADGLRPDSITFRLLADGSVLQSVRVTKEDNWAYTFRELPVYKEGKAIVYTVEEEPVDGYESAAEGYAFTNTHQPEPTEITVTKIWDDEDDHDGFRPQRVTVRLLADGKEVASAAITVEGNWTYTFKDLPKYRDHGTEIVYTVTEDSVKEYETTVDGFTITNRHEPVKIELPVTKVWIDNNNKAGKRPDSITIHLLADGKEIETVKITPDARGNWGYTFTDLPKYAGGKEIKYTVTEDPVKGYYTSVDTTKDGIRVRNSTTPITGDPSQTTLWAALFAVSLLGLACLVPVYKRRRAE